MGRLGELLVAAGRLTPAQLEEGLRAQVLYGGRLGTNLVELFHLDLDVLALALARLHGVPAALGKHFERCDVTVQARLPVEVARRWSVVPIGHLADGRGRIAVASIDPLPPEARVEIAAALGCAPRDLVASIAAELRIRYFLERAYGIARASRYLRVRRQTSHEVPEPPPDWDDRSSPALDVDLELEIDVDADDDAPAGGTDPEVTRLHDGLRPDTLDEPTGDVIATARWPRVDTLDEPTLGRAFGGAGEGSIDIAFDLDDDDGLPEIDGEADQVLINERRRRFVRTLSDADVEVEAEADPEPAAPPPPLPLPPRPAPLPAPPRPAPSPAAAARPAPPARPAAAPPPPADPGPAPDGAIARIAIRKVRTAAAREGQADLGSLDGATRAVRRAPTRERVGDLVVRAARALTGDALAAVVVFVVREPIAVGWKGEVAGAEPALDEIAVPLDEPSLVAHAVAAGDALALDLADATELDLRLVAALGGPPPTRAIAAPVLIARHPVCLIYAHGTGVAAAEATVRALAEAAGTAFGRLLRAAQR